MMNTKDGELVCIDYSLPGGHELMIRRVPDGQAYDYWLYVNGARAYGPYWRAAEAYKRLKQLGGTYHTQGWVTQSEETHYRLADRRRGRA